MVYTTKSQLSHSKTSTPAPIANIAGGKYLLSAFNQFKRFLALSLLITFSFNAFSVDNSQQPNKEEFNIRLYDKNSESDYFFFPPPKSEYFFQQHW
jgi:hypothetical protein